MGGECNTHGTEQTEVEGFAGGPELKRPCEISRHKWVEIPDDEA